MNGIIVALTSSVLGILCGIIAIISGTVAAIKRHNNEMRIRESIIENKVDAETAKILVTQETPKKKSPYSALRWGLALLGIGTGYLCAWALHIGDDMGTFVLMAGGCGVGLLISFFISSQMEEKKASRTDYNQYLSKEGQNQ